MKFLRKHLWQFSNLTDKGAAMNEFITVSKSGYVETRNFESSPLPIWFYPFMTKYKDTIFLVNKHIDTEFLFMVSGELKIHLDNDTFIAKEGDIVAINPNVLHNIIPLSPSVTYHCLIIDREFIASHHLPTDEVHIKEVINDKFVFKKSDAIRSLLESDDTYKAPKIHSLILDMMICVMENFGRKKQINPKERMTVHAVEKGIGYINNHFKEQISLEEIAEFAGYSKFYFSRIFKETTGYPLSDYINMQRIKYAHKLLSESDINVSEVAFKCGFKSISYFSTTYKKYMGYSPSNK